VVSSQRLTTIAVAALCGKLRKQKGQTGGPAHGHEGTTTAVSATSAAAMVDEAGAASSFSAIKRPDERLEPNATEVWATTRSLHPRFVVRYISAMTGRRLADLVVTPQRHSNHYVLRNYHNMSTPAWLLFIRSGVDMIMQV